MHMKMEDQKKGLLLSGYVSCFLLSCLIAVSANDVPDGVVFTDLTKTVHQGDRAVLKCHFYGTPIAVYWKKGYDPTQSPNLITWVEGETPSGSCVQDKACEMHDDFSLIINEVKIADQGRYICRVSNYLGILIHNFTDLNIFASPKEPYPVIEGCNSSRQSCVIHTIHPINITCSVYGYYPDVDLFMLHGANRLDILNIEEAVNKDGTKSKSISTRATVSETQYICVASDIPGTTNQRTVTALVAPIVSNDTKASETPPHNSSFQGQTTPLNTTNNVESEKHVSHIVVPIVVILLTCFLLAFVFWKTHRHTKVEPADTDIDPESIPMLKKEPEKGNVSFYEIWVLLYNTKGIDMVGIHHVLTELGIEDVNENSTKWQTYSALCKWKDQTTLADQAELIRDAFYNARYEEAWKNIERSSKMLAKASEGTLERIVRSIDDQELRNKFMNKLIPGRAANNPEPPTHVKSISQQDMVTELKKWSSITSNENQMVLLSIALEDAGCCPVDRRFFTRTLSFYEIWCLLYNTESTCLDIAGIRRTFQELGIDVEGDLSKQRAYTLFCRWKDNTAREHQTMILRDSLEKAKLERVWDMSEQRANMSSKISEYICEKIMRSIGDQQLKNKFLNRLIPGRAAHNPETPGSVTSISQQDMVKELKEWSSTTDNENQMVSLSIALEEAECRPVDRGFFTRTLSFHEIWCLVYNTESTCLDKAGIRRMFQELGIDVEGDLSKQRAYTLFCRWKDNTAKEHQTMILKDSLENAKLERVWDMSEQRANMSSKVSEYICEKIMRSIGDQQLKNKFLNRLIPGRAAHNPETPGSVTSISHQDMVKELKEWSSTTDNENQMVVLSIALEEAECRPVDRTFFTGMKVSFFELSLVAYDGSQDNMMKLQRLLNTMGINDVNPTEYGIYKGLCEWKNKEHDDQMSLLRDELCTANLTDVWEQIYEQRANMSSKVSAYICEKIMRSINDHQLKNRFLNRLIPGRATHNPDTPGSVKNISQQDMVKELKEWSSTTDNGNQMVLLSIALEETECRPVDRTFFTGMKVSFFELWSVAYDGSQDNKMKLQRLLNTMGINDVNPTKYGIYKGLCEWKNKEHDDQMSLLRDELCAANLTDVWEHINGLREKRGANVPDDTLSHILWHIQSPMKVEDLLSELIPDRKNQQVSKVVTKESIGEATQVLRKWRAGPFQQNPFVLLSLALETAGCLPLDREFFTVPDHLKKPISSQEVEACVHSLTGRHCRRLAKAVGVSEDKKISATIHENTEMLLDTQSMIRDWIDRQQCSHYQKRCRLTQAVIEIGRHDLINCFGVKDHYRSFGKDPGGLHPDPHQFNHESAYIDDIREIVSFLPKERRADFCKEMMISLNKDGEDEKDLEPHDLENMITATNTLYEPLEKLVQRFQLALTKANCRGFEVTDEELEIAAKFINAANTKLQPSQRQPATRIETDTAIAYSGTPHKTATGSGNDNGNKEESQKLEAPKDKQVTTEDGTRHADSNEHSSKTDVEGNNTHLAASNEVSHPEKASEEIHGNDENEENLKQIVGDSPSNTQRSVSFMLKRWKSFYRKKETCHNELRKSLETLGLKECIVNVAPAKYLYKVELLRIAFNLLMRDVLPFIDALGMNPKQITEYIASSPELERGSLGLLQQLWKRTPKSDTHRRRDFCLALRNIGYEGLARSVYLDYEPSQSELNSTVSVLWSAERLQTCTRLELGEDDRTACLGPEGEVNLVEVVRRWKNQIRPVPYHYRLEIGTCLRAVGRQDVADNILAGRKGKMEADENVIRNICGRLEADQINNLCKLLDLKTGQSQKEYITSVTNWVIKWINDFDPSSKKPKLPGSQHKLQHRKNINNNMFYLGCHELAEEIMHLENGILSE